MPPAEKRRAFLFFLPPFFFRPFPFVPFRLTPTNHFSCYFLPHRLCSIAYFWLTLHRQTGPCASARHKNDQIKIIMDIKNRRTIRRYTTQGVDNQLLTRLLKEASQTPTMGNLQLYSVVVTHDAAAKQRLAPAHFNQPMVTQAPVVLTFCADFRRTTLWAKERLATPGYDNFLSFINAATDALLYCQSFCNLAEAEGLGTCFLGTTVYQPDALIDALQLPRLVMPVATITLGWPDEQPALQDRLPIEAILHEEHYHDYTPASIDRCYAEKESLEVNREFVRINHKETLAQVFTDLRYTKKDNEAMSDGLIKALRRQGFMG